MDLLQSETFFKDYNGLKFHMFREEPLKYNEYKNLCVPQSLEETWRQNIVDDEINLLLNLATKQSINTPIWTIQDKLIQVLSEMNENQKHNATSLFNAFEKIDFNELSKKERILIAENMSGRDDNFKDGAIFFICTNSDLKSPLSTLVDRLLDFSCTYDDNEHTIGWRDITNRYFVAQNNCIIAFSKVT